LFLYYGDLFYYILPFKRKEQREGQREGQRTDLPSVFFKEGRSERKRGREREKVGNKRGERQGRGTSLPLKTDLTLVIYKILEKTFVF
jgi:hypothetical protein